MTIENSADATPTHGIYAPVRAHIQHLSSSRFIVKKMASLTAAIIMYSLVILFFFYGTQNIVSQNVEADAPNRFGSNNLFQT